MKKICKLFLIVFCVLFVVILIIFFFGGKTTEIKQDVVFSELVGEIDLDNLDNNSPDSENCMTINLNLFVKQNIFGIMSCTGTIEAEEEYQIGAFSKSVGDTYVMSVGNNNKSYANVVFDSALNKFIYIPHNETSVYLGKLD